MLVVMRILHTSDWHLGRSLHEVDLHGAQADALEAIAVIAEREQVDCVVVAGDVFDRAIPPVESVRLLESALGRLRAIAPVVVTAGNHDSTARLGYGSSLFVEGLHLVTDPASVGTPVQLADEHGPVLVYPLPYLDPDAVRSVLAPGRGDDAHALPRSHEAVLAAAMDRVRADLSRRRDDHGVDTVRSVVVAHAFVVGGRAVDSERDIRVGGIETVPSEVFSGIDYVALGHLHGPQEPRSHGGSGRLRYSGSPLRYSFSEAEQAKSVTIVDLDRSGSTTVRSVPIPQPREMARISGTMGELLSDKVAGRLAEHWLQVTVTDEVRPVEMLSRLRARFPHALVLQHHPARAGHGVSAKHDGEAVCADPLEVMAAFVLEVTGGQASPAEAAVLRQAYEAVVHAGREA